MMAFEIWRPKAKTFVMLINLAVLAGVGGWTLYNELRGPEVSGFGLLLGVVLLLWAAWIGYNLPRSLVLRLDESGIVARGVVGTHRIGWGDLLWVDFTRPTAAALLRYVGTGGTDAVVVLTRNAASDAERAEALRIIQQHRPDVPLASPTPLVTLRGTP